MAISARKLKTLYKKDMIDYARTPAISAASFVPILFVVMYKMLRLSDRGEDKVFFLLTLGMLMNSVMCAILVPSTMIAEEKEKFTLRTLMLSNVSAMEFFLSKIFATATIILAGNIVIFFIAGADVKYLPAYIFSTILGNACVIMLSAVIGIMSRDQMSSSVLQIPVMLVLMLPPVFAGGAKIMQTLTHVTPYGAMLKLYYQLTEGGFKMNQMLPALAVIGVWFAASMILFVYFYKKKGTDN